MKQLLGRLHSASLAGEASAAAADVMQPSPVPDPLAGAFFDVDNTLMRGASIYHFARGLAARKMFGPRELAKMAFGQVLFRLIGAENAGHIAAARESALAFVAGHKISDIVALGEEIYDDTMASQIWAGSRDLTQRHLAAGQRVWLVTATPVELANIVSRRLGLTGALGTVAETADGTYTGGLVGGLLHGDAKAAAVRALAQREGLDLARCSAYSDSVNDLPMLRLVGHPHVVNPDVPLRAVARAENWPVHDFRRGRRATVVALPVAAGVGAAAGGMAAAIAVRRRWPRAAAASAPAPSRLVRAARLLGQSRPARPGGRPRPASSVLPARKAGAARAWQPRAVRPPSSAAARQGGRRSAAAR